MNGVRAPLVSEPSDGPPIVIVTAGRSGSGVLHRALARHPRVAWASRLLGTHPRRPWLNRAVLRAVDVPLLGSIVRRRYPPVECYPFWERHCRGFTAPCRDLRAEDLTQEAKLSLRGARRQLPTGRRRRLLFKITGWPRIGLLKEAFPDARFIHLVRDGRAAAASLLRVHWWDGWQGPPAWRMGPLTAAHVEEWEAHGRSFIALAGIQWKMLLAAAREAERTLPPDDVLELRYEEMCAEPLHVFRRVAAFAELRWSAGFESAVRSSSFRNTNARWRSDLTEAQQEVLTAVLRDALEREGYARTA